MLRKSAAILFLIVFSFNLAGYRLIIAFLETKADKKLEAIIDNNEYADGDLLEMRVSLNMPYQHRYTDFERHYGQISINGKEYTYVKKKIEGDILILKCIPNDSKTQLKNIAADITKANNSSGPQDKSPVKSAVKIFSFECDDVFSSPFTFSETTKQKTFLQFTDKLAELNSLVLLQPPRLIYC